MEALGQILISRGAASGRERRLDYGTNGLALLTALLLASGDHGHVSQVARVQLGLMVSGDVQQHLQALSARNGVPARIGTSDGLPPPAETGSFRLLTYNVAGLPDAISPSHPATNMPLISPLLNHYELAMVQEDFYYHAELIGQARHAFRSEHAATFALPADGLAVLSSFALGRLLRIRWADCNGYVLDASDCLADKGFSFGTVALAPGISVHAYNVHADAGRSSADEWVRRSNFEQLAEFIQSRSRGHAVIVAGDTNLHLSSAVDAVTYGQFLHDTELDDACAGHGDHEERIDRVLFRSSALIQLTAAGCWRDARFVDPTGRALSDHPAVSVELRWHRSLAGNLVMTL